MSKKQSFSDKARNILSGTENADKPKSMRDFLQDTPEAEVQGPADATFLDLHKSDGVPLRNTTPEAPEQTDRLHCFIPRSLKLRVESYVLVRKRERKKGEKIDITSVVIEALTEKLEREGG